MRHTQREESVAAVFVQPYGPQPGEALPSDCREPDAGYHLFRRAIVDRVEAAWEAIYQTYAPMVFSWVLNHPCFWKAGEDAAYFVNRAFEKMWLALSPERFANFPDLKALLKYLQICVHSVIIDHVRMVDHRTLALALDGNGETEPADTVDSVERVLEEVWHAEVWARIRRRVNEREARILICRFLCGMKPSQIYAQCPQDFASIAEIYGTLQNVLNRLRRDPELQHFISAL